MARCLNCMNEYDGYKEVCPVCGFAIGTPPKEVFHLYPGTEIGGRYILSGDQVEVPEVIARDMESAEKKIGDAGLVPQYVDYIEDDNIPGDCVYSQSPGANERISKGDTVFLVLSCGVEKKTMPNLVGYKKERAISRLEAMGVTVQETEVESNGNPGSVVRQLCSGEVIEEGAEISEGMVVTLEISTGRPDIYDASGMMPDFTGKTYEEALEMARESHIYIYITQDSPDEKYDRGLIIGQQYKNTGKCK